MLSPRRIGMAASRVRSPWAAMAMVRPMVAELAWTTMVTAVPTRTPSRGLELKARKRSFLSRRKTMDDSMVCIPRNRRPKPTIPLPMYFCRLVLPKRTRRTPSPSIGRAKSLILKATIWAVTVVPMLAPMMTPTACFRVMSPA
ncbi:hypothetical protein SDC9_52828 [bioreactor metagenome]|uniref:Uncharacterized protein n=1 Tax=bioreactor metagenome TaxID=1076179 RepID=A0A644WS73_9ZZZZ